MNQLRTFLEHIQPIGYKRKKNPYWIYKDTSEAEESYN
jgi:hypothetical protein